MKKLIIVLVIILVFLQYELWLSPNGVREYFGLKSQIAEQKQENAKLDTRNQEVSKNINNLKQSREAVEEHARNDLGMIKPDETFYEVIQPQNQNQDKSH